MRRPLAPGRFGAVVTAMVTPFDAEGALDLDGAATLARWLVAHGSDALVVAGTTGESPVLGDAEKLDLIEAVAQAVTVPVIAGTGSNDTAHSIELTRQAAPRGASAVLVVAPYYNRPSQRGLVQHFEAVAEATSLPVMLYDVPARTGRKVAPETVLEVAAHRPNVVALKDASGDLVGATRVLGEAPAGFDLYSGDDVATLALCALGAAGVVSVASHWVGPQLRALLTAFWAGDTAEAAEIHCRLLPLLRVQSSDEFPSPLPAKAICRAQGLPVGQCRLPLGPAPAALDELARDVVAQLEPAPAGALGSVGR
ncbi:4-hydroxy-tetrahydrodipicolinate synthase [Aciditerrimonas ferrireducens]|jgi:4-hydroxy-tetrahydrodipicolinate synthase|uniref:4-hydroxy-tetrahydrodipicolinate synthase n=1 Tax=Aciditerrimonas ferrireducens TaxID=667306 RepID=A0ABV6C2B8_9ACTN